MKRCFIQLAQKQVEKQSFGESLTFRLNAHAQPMTRSHTEKTKPVQVCSIETVTNFRKIVEQNVLPSMTMIKKMTKTEFITCNFMEVD